jgi:hypothetical protein
MYDADIIIIRTIFGSSAAMSVYHWALPIAADYYYENGPYPRLPIHSPLNSTALFRNLNGKIEFFSDGYPRWGEWVPVTEKTILLTDTENGGLRRLTHLSYATYKDTDGVVSFDIDFKPYTLDTQRKILPAGPLYRFLNKN